MLVVFRPSAFAASHKIVLQWTTSSRFSTTTLHRHQFLVRRLNHTTGSVCRRIVNENGNDNFHHGVVPRLQSLRAKEERFTFCGRPGGIILHRSTTTRLYSTTTTTNNSSGETTTTTTNDEASKQQQLKDLDDVCRKHMDLPAQEFAMGCSFLHQVAVGAKLEELVKILDDLPSLVNFRDYDRRTALHVAASEGHLEICQWLVQQGAKINRSDRWGGSPLDDAHRCRHHHVVQYLKDQGGKFGSPSQSNNFISAASEGDVDEIQELLEFGNVDINQSDYDRRTALHLAATEGHLDVVSLLCKAGANVNAQDRRGHSPLDDAKTAGHTECIEFLEEHGAVCGKHVDAQMGQDALLDLMHHYGKVRNGELTMDWHEVKNMLEGIGEESSDEVVQKLFHVADMDGDGCINLQEFVANSDTFLGGRPARIILVVGGPGSGKGVLCKRLVKECGVVHLSSGDLLREEVSKGTALGQKVQDIMKSGGLVSSAIMVTLMKKRMRDHPGKRILLDGFPRSRENAEDLVTLCGRPELALHLTCDDTVLLERIMKRGQSGERADDNFHTAIERIRTYHKFHNTTLDFLREEHVPIVFLDCSATPDGIWDQLRAIGRLMRSAVKLTSDKGGNNNSGAGGGGTFFPIP